MKNGSLGIACLVAALLAASIAAQNPPPTVQFSAANYSVNENAGSATLTITKFFDSASLRSE